MGVLSDKLDVTKVSLGWNGEEKEPYGEEFIHIENFFENVVGAYNEGSAEIGLPADVDLSRSLVPAGTGALRDFSYIAPEIPEFITENCVGCMDCVTQCPDTAILAKVVDVEALEKELAQVESPAEREAMRQNWAKTTKYHAQYEKKGQAGGLFGIFIDPTKCKGCAECVVACGEHQALRMIQKEDDTVPNYRQSINFFRRLPETPPRFIQERVLADMMLAERSMLYVGGAGSCAGCGEATVLRMMLAATGFVYGPENVGIVASTGCNTVYTSTYPYNPYLVPWTNSLFENSPTTAMGVRARWDQLGWQNKRLWVIGGDGAMLDIGFQALSRMLASGADIKVLVLDTQVYSNTGGQASTASFTGQETKMSAIGKEIHGKTERRKELGLISMMHPNVFVAQTTAAHVNHFYRAIMEANSFPGPAVINVYTTCQPEHGVGDNMSYHQAKLAVDSRAFPLFIYDPRKGATIKERLSLQGNPAVKEDWYKNPKTGEVVDFLAFARSEGRFAKNFEADGNPKDALHAAQADRLANWHRLQELAGII
ncbi:MAG: thiamine pyrophosphate-binding protein [Anaerolineae bacterium]|nr:thiamine pyrophosphate-binding protein [Anaerolineae bacterium]